MADSAAVGHPLLALERAGLGVLANDFSILVSERRLALLRTRRRGCRRAPGVRQNRHDFVGRRLDDHDLVLHQHEVVTAVLRHDLDHLGRQWLQADVARHDCAHRQREVHVGERLHVQVRNRRTDAGPLLVVDVHRRVHVGVRRTIGRVLLAAGLLGRVGRTATRRRLSLVGARCRRIGALRLVVRVRR
ncbi:hypothetical protein ACVWW7_001917 [Bradyrhizobium sp. LM6.9]